MEEERKVHKRRLSTIKISVNEISEATKKTMVLRVITSVILAIIVVPAIFLGGWYFLALVFLASFLAVFEIMAGTRISKKYWYIYLIVIISVFAVTFWNFFKKNFAANIANGYVFLDITKWVVDVGFDTIGVSSFLLATILIGLFILLVFDKHFNFDIAAYLFLLILFSGFGFQSFIFLRLYPEFVAVEDPLLNTLGFFTSSFLVVYIILGTIMNDIGAYFIGVLFGKHKMAPRISPNKTWEGFVGGVVTSFVFSLLFALIVSWSGHPILSILTHKEWYYLVLISLVMPLAANIGDLFFSATKRHLNMKDYGFILAGHGGILDRIDSLLLVSIVASMLIILINNQWSLLV